MSQKRIRRRGIELAEARFRLVKNHCTVIVFLLLTTNETIF